MINKKTEDDARRLMVFVILILLIAGGVIFYLTNLPSSKSAAESLAKRTLIDASHLSYSHANNVVVHSNEQSFNSGWGTADVVTDSGTNQNVTFAYKHASGLRTFLYVFDDWIPKDIARKLSIDLSAISNVQFTYPPSDMVVSDTGIRLVFDVNADVQLDEGLSSRSYIYTFEATFSDTAKNQIQNTLVEQNSP